MRSQETSAHINTYINCASLPSMTNINQTMSGLFVMGAYFSRSLSSVEEFNIKSELGQKKKSPCRAKKFRNINLGHSEDGENNEKRERK